MLGEWPKQYEPTSRGYTLGMSKAVQLKRLTHYFSNAPSNRA